MSEARPRRRCRAVLPAGPYRGPAVRRSSPQSRPRPDGDGPGGRGAVVLAEGDPRKARAGADVLRAADGVMFRETGHVSGFRRGGLFVFCKLAPSDRTSCPEWNIRV